MNFKKFMKKCQININVVVSLIFTILLLMQSVSMFTTLLKDCSIILKVLAAMVGLVSLMLSLRFCLAIFAKFYLRYSGKKELFDSVKQLLDDIYIPVTCTKCSYDIITSLSEYPGIEYQAKRDGKDRVSIRVLNGDNDLIFSRDIKFFHNHFEVSKA